MLELDVKIVENECVYFSIILLDMLSDKQLSAIEQELGDFFQTRVPPKHNIRLEHSADPVGKYWLSPNIKISGRHIEPIDVVAMGVLLNEIIQLKDVGSLKMIKALSSIEEWAITFDDTDEKAVLEEMLKLPDLLCDAGYVVTTEISFDVMVYNFEFLTDRPANDEEVHLMKAAVVAAKCMND